MKVIFLEDVPNVAQAGEMKEVADGYGRNFLLPRKLAVLANRAATEALESQRKTRERNQARTQAEQAELAAQMEGKEITLTARAGEQDRLFGSVTSADIATELQNSTGLTVDKKKIELEQPIHHLGTYDVVIKLAKDIAPTIKVTVIKEETG